MATRRLEGPGAAPSPVMYNPLIMTPEIAASGDPQPAGMSEASRLAGVFFEPKKAFADIAARPRWIVPLILMILMGIGITMLYSQKGVMRIAAEQQMTNNAQFQQLPPDQRAQRLESGMKIATILGYCVPIFIPLAYLVMALVLWAIVSGILSAPVRFGQVFAIVTYAQLPGLLMSILIVIVLQLKNAADYNLQNPLMFNPGAFMDPQTSPKFVYSLASSLDLFTIWILLLVATGLGRRRGQEAILRRRPVRCDAAVGRDYSRQGGVRRTDRVAVIAPRLLFLFLHAGLRRLGCGDNLIRLQLRYVIVVVELHGERCATLRHRGQIALVAQHFGHRSLCANELRGALRIHSGNPAAAAVEIAHEITRVFHWRLDLHIHHRFE